MVAYGSFSTGAERRLGVRFGDRVLDLALAAERLRLPDRELFGGPVLNPFLAAGRAVWERTHAALASYLDSGPDEDLLVGAHTLHLAWDVADYVDFYSSEQHATNVGRIFRPGAAALPANWKHLPIGYHGRAGTVVVSGTPVRRPSGQRLEGAAPVFGPSRRLDFEAEVGFVVGRPAPGPVPGADFAEHVFGVVLVNDWSARDLQAWEYVPLGPFLGKSFATSVSAWVTPLSELEGARVALPPRDVPTLSYLDEPEPWGLDLALEVELNGQVLSRPGFASMYWSPAQQLAHLTVNGASLRTGDLYASGTVSDATEFGSLLELSWGGERPVTVGAGTRSFLADGDEVVLRATAGAVELGEVRGVVQPG